ncbi:hypothetical protein [Mesorhizobium escarrei]|uniref:Uncharacterized protein n=1 Tax=Mesorhizobium escarrei TaxID=666018 RepID=A0ABN8JPE7_9HYPH|nr:hypothetical protein [Mesorhizobium escarrei]CAH2399060.1 hypothetical protein MES5069_210100 [Mesorhizobium escarrei]
MFPPAGRKPVRPGGQPVTPNRLPGRPQWLGLPALYLMLHGNPALEPIVATGSMIVAASLMQIRSGRLSGRGGALGLGVLFIR